MALGIDAQVLAEMTPLLEALGATEPLAIGDVESRRVNGHRMFDYVASTWEPAAGVQVDRHTLTTADGATLDLDWYHTPAGQPGSAVLYLHGGGMIFGLEHLGRVYDLAVRDYVATSGVPMLLVDYRIAPEHPYPTPVEDCYAALRWLVDNAATLGVDPARIGVMGDSAGGGLAAAVASAAAAGAASGGLGALAARFIGRKRAELIETMISEGGLVLFVRVRSEEAERRAEQIMRDQGVEAVRVHEITIDKRLKNLPLADVIARCS